MRTESSGRSPSASASVDNNSSLASAGSPGAGITTSCPARISRMRPGSGALTTTRGNLRLAGKQQAGAGGDRGGVVGRAELPVLLAHVATGAARGALHVEAVGE